MIYAVNYDLCRPGQNYEGMQTAIKSCGSWWHYLGSTWLVHTNLTAGQIYQRLAPHIDTNDNVLVIQVGNDYQGWLQQEAWDWIKQRLSVFA